MPSKEVRLSETLRFLVSEPPQLDEVEETQEDEDGAEMFQLDMGDHSATSSPVFGRVTGRTNSAGQSPMNLRSGE